MKIQRIDNSVSFTRRPNAHEMKIYTESLNKGLGLLNKQVDLILHNASAPAVKSENTGIGSLLSRTVEEKLLPFLRAHGFKGIQQEPDGIRKVGDNSPYAPEASAKNILMIPLEKLTGEKYGAILSKETFDTIVKNNPSPDNVDYDYVRKSYDKALREAFENGKNSDDFLKFKKENESVYEQSAIFRILTKINGTDEFKKWDKPYRELYVDKNSEQSQKIINGLKEKYQQEYDYFLFQQMILEREYKDFNNITNKMGINIIGDSPVAPTAVEQWVNQDLFLKGKAIGCPPDYFSPDGQRWDFPYYDPEKMFNKDGSLGEAGKAMKKKYEEYFSKFPGGIRIDHTIGLIDPFIYTTSAPKMTTENSGRIFSIFTGKYQKNSVEEYGAIFEKIILPAARKYGLDKSSVICEDLGEKTVPTDRVIKKLGLSGISVTQFDYRGATAPENNVIMLGSHDNSSFLEFIKDIFNFGFNNEKRERFLNKTKLLSEDTIQKDATNEQKDKYLYEIRTDKRKFLSASFTELFTSPAKRVQIFFTDFFGIGKTYNRPGTTDGNWSLRMGENFEEDYYKAVSEGKAPNMAEIISRALRQRGLDKNNNELMQNLDNSAKILKE